jgi:hypothetical protein
VARPLHADLRREVRLVGAEVRLEVVAGREARPGAAHDRDPHRVVAVGAAQRLEQLAAERVRERVALLRPVQRDALDAGRGTVDEDQAGLLAHGFFSTEGGRRAYHPEGNGPSDRTARRSTLVALETRTLRAVSLV